MQIVLDQRKNSKILDSIEYILNTDKKEFNKMLSILNKPNGVLDFSYRYELEDPDVTQTLFVPSEFFKEISEIDQSEINEDQIDRINKLQKCRTKDKLKKQISKEYKLDRDEVERVFEVLEGKVPFSELIEQKEIRNKEKAQKRNVFSFLRFMKNRLLPEGKDSVEDYYTYIMEKIVRGKYSFNYFIPEQSEHYNRLSLIENRIKAEREIEGYSTVIGEKDEPDWKINDELKEYVYKDMPENLSSEEQAVWVYMKLCQTLHYDDRQVFENNKDNKINVDLLESVKPNSRVICFDFSRIYAKFVNSIPDKDLEAKVIGGKGHFLVELVSKNIVAKVEATSVRSTTNEFYKVKMGLPIEGIETLSDEKNIISDSITRFTPLVYNGDVKTMSEYMTMLDTIRADENEDNDILLDKLNSLTKTMRERNISGMEAITGVIKFSSLGFLGEDIERAWIKEKVNGDEEGYKSCLIVNKKGGENHFYILNSTNMTVEQLEKGELIERFKSGQYDYKDKNYTIKALKDKLSDCIPEESEEDVEK